MTALHGLTRSQRRELEGELLAERARLERSMDAPGAGEGGVALALATRTHARYAAILDALSRLATGSYGACAGCNARIPYGRLLVMPEATRCVACGPRL